MPIDKTKLTKEMLEKASMCQTADELIALAKIKGIEITKDEAEAYIEELENVELDEAALEKIAGGRTKPQKHCSEYIEKSIYD